MYLGHFSLREAPFAITPDTDFFYPHEGAQASLNMLLVALRGGEGFVKVVGELGCGKTVLCRQLLKLLQEECVTAYIPNPDMGPEDLLLALACELGLQVSAAAQRHQILNLVGECLLAHARQGRRVIVCIDEAQAIPVRTVESLRLLSNLETEKRKLLQLVLLGQPDLDEKLARPEIRQLLQRITFSEYLGPMRAQRVAGYLRHRLATAAQDENTELGVFGARASAAIAHYSGGVPRLINILAHKCLMLAYGEDVRRVTTAHVHLSARDTPGVAQRMPWWTGLRSLWGIYHPAADNLNINARTNPGAGETP
jgi:MSHA biogenesis protein MshM